MKRLFAVAQPLSVSRLPRAARWEFLLAMLCVGAFAAAPLPTLGEVFTRAPADDVGLSSSRLQQLSDVIEEYVDQAQLAGAVVLVARRGKVAYLESFGFRDREAGDRLEDNDIFRIASQSKALVSVAVMMLQEQGKLLISDPLFKYLPAFRDTTVAVKTGDGAYEVVPAKRPVTIRDLLTHSAGVGYGGGVAADQWQAAGITGWYFADRDEPIAETVSRMAALPFDAQPGERMVYGYSTDILGAVIEQVSGMSLDKFLRKNILDPLKMNDTHFYLPRTKADRLTVVYSASEDSGLTRAPDPGGMVGQGAYLEGPRKSFSGGAGLLSTAGDYGRFLQMLLNGGELDGTRVLSRKSVQLMTVNHLGAEAARDFGGGLGFGLGFYVLEDLGERGAPGSIGEYGWGGAYHSNYWVDPKEQLVVVYLAQLIPAAGLKDQAQVRAIVYGAIVD